MNLKHCVGRTFIFGLLTAILIAMIAFLIFEKFVHQQNIIVQKERVQHLLNGLMPLVKEEVLTERVYAISSRGQDFWLKHASEGLEFGIYKPDGTPLFETHKSALIRKLLNGGTDPHYVFDKRNIYFANELAGQVVFALKADHSGRMIFHRYLLIFLGLLLFAFLFLFLIIQYFMNRWVVQPAKRLADSIPLLEKYLANQSDEPGVPTNLGILELDKIGSALRSAIVKFHDASKERKMIELVAAKQASFAQVANQVAHDIRSPLTALDVASANVSELPEEKRLLIRNAVSRIKDIANSLVLKSREAHLAEGISSNDEKTAEEMHAWLLPTLVDELVTEKRLQHRSKIGIEILVQYGKGTYGLFAKIQPTAFKRVLSNIVNNAVEAIAEKGQIIVGLKSDIKNIILTIQDNGKSIPSDILPALMQRGTTYGKKDGSGLGLFHAKESLVKWGGSLKIDSEIGKGTTLIIKLPKEDPPNWFVPELVISSDSIIVILDDDISIHQIWENRLNEIISQVQNLNIMHFSTADGLKEWCTTHYSFRDKTIYLIDYELLGENDTGLTLIRALGIQEMSILVTSRYEELDVLNQCASLGVKLIPKPMAGHVPIFAAADKKAAPVCSTPLEKPDCILIDDDHLIHVSWKISAKQNNKSIRTYNSVDEFLNDAKMFDKGTNIFIDSNLGEGLKGEKLSKRIYDAGFRNIFIATGYYDASSFDDLPWIKGIVGKDPPWA